ncbi:MAG: SdpI family protein [SAR324 cluster bacterium]|nr:SdpI family protein [SAR324 cluster bacterium]
MFRYLWKYLGMNAVLIAATLPLVFHWVPPNRWYGFRLPGTGASPELWYGINATGGKMFILSMIICASVNLLFLWRGLEKARPYLGWINGGLILLSFWIVSQVLVQYLP